MTKSSSEAAGIDLYWLPLGAGGNFVRLYGRLYEAIEARLQHRKPNALYHSGLEVIVPEGRYVIEQTPVVNNDGPYRGVVAEGPVGVRWAGRWRVFRYEVRRWRDGVIPDVNEAVDSPQRLMDDAALALRILELVPDVPTPVWGRDELHAGEMWNSNSLISWLIARSGLDVEAVHPPVGGRAPGWGAGVVVARRQPLQNGVPSARGSSRPGRDAAAQPARRDRRPDRRAVARRAARAAGRGGR